MQPPRVSLVGTLKNIPVGSEATFTFKELTPSAAALRTCACKLNKKGLYGRFSVKADLARELYTIRRTATHL